jgi:hypothetical protein
LSESCMQPGTWNRRSAITRRRPGCSRGSLSGGGPLHALVGGEVRINDDQSAYWPVQRPAQVRLPATCQRVRRFCEYLSVRKRGGGGRQPSSVALTTLNAEWEADMVDRALVPAARDAYGRVARGYLTFLGSRGVCSIDAADGASVLALVESLSPRWATTSLFW